MARQKCVLCGTGAQDRPALRQHSRVAHGGGVNLTTGELAARFGMTPAGIEAWRRRGQGPRFMKFGRAKTSRVIYRLKDVEAYEQQQVSAR